MFACLKLRRNSIFTLNLCYWKSISIRPGQTGLCQSNPHSFMPLSLCDVSVLLHGIITSNTAEAFFLYFCCKAIREQTEVAYDLIGPTQYQRRKRYRILNFKSHTTHYPFFHRQITQNVSTKWVPKSSSWKVFGINHPQTLSTEKSFLLIPKTLQGLHFLFSGELIWLMPNIIFFQGQWHCHINFYCAVAIWICQHFILSPLYAQISWIWHSSWQMFWPL